MDKKWNLQDIRPSGERKKRTQATREHAPREETVTSEPAAVPKRASAPKRERKKRRSVGVLVAALLLILIPGFVIGFMLDGATITTYPRVREPNVNAVFEAFREPQANELSYEIMTLEAEGERQVRATGEEQVAEQATGEIVISNTRETSERLIKNTRFESSNGLIFRITESAVVPAATRDADGTIVPGTVRAEVFADEPGEAYNIGPSTFTVPGYEEGGFDELFAAVTAESTSPMQGGYEGPRYIVDDAELAAAKESLHAELEEALNTRVDEERPAGFIFFEDGITYSYVSLPSEESGNDMVTIKERALLHAPIFESGEFARTIAAATIPGYERESVALADPSVLSFRYTATSTAETDIRDLDSISFELTGKPLVVWTFDETMLKEDLAGSPKSSLTTVLSDYPAIERAEAVIRPFWKRSFPTNPEEIQVAIVSENREEE